MNIRLNTDTHASERHHRGETPSAMMYNIRRLNELYQELDQIIATVQPPRGRPR